LLILPLLYPLLFSVVVAMIAIATTAVCCC
jgi:hypothetical protein